MIEPNVTKRVMGCVLLVWMFGSSSCGGRSLATETGVEETNSEYAQPGTGPNSVSDGTFVLDRSDKGTGCAVRNGAKPVKVECGKKSDSVVGFN